MIISTEIKPQKDELDCCPLCGGNAVFSHNTDWGYYDDWTVICEKPRCILLSRCFVDREGAAKIWNNRVNDITGNRG